MAIDEWAKRTRDKKVYRFYAMRLPLWRAKLMNECHGAMRFMEAADERVNVKSAVVRLNTQWTLGMKFQTSIKKYQGAWTYVGSTALLAKRAVPLSGGRIGDGFYTKFGDGAADIIPLWLNKRQGRAMLQV